MAKVLRQCVNFVSHRGSPIRVRTAAGILIHIDPRDARGQGLIGCGGNLHPLALAAWHLLLSEAPWTHVVDVGANYGEMLVNGGLPPQAKIIALEPNPRVRRYLKRTLKRLRGDITVVAAAASDRIGQADLLVDQNWSGCTRLRRPEDIKLPPAHMLISVPVTSLAALFRSAAPLASIRAAVKIDVEGQEIAVLRGAAEVLDELGDFAALVEVPHLTPDQLAWLVERFEVRVYGAQSHRLEPVAPASAARLTELLQSGRFHSLAVVLRRKPPAVTDPTDILTQIVRDRERLI